MIFLGNESEERLNEKSYISTNLYPLAMEGALEALRGLNFKYANTNKKYSHMILQECLEILLNRKYLFITLSYEVKRIKSQVFNFYELEI